MSIYCFQHKKFFTDAAKLCGRRLHNKSEVIYNVPTSKAQESIYL